MAFDPLAINQPEPFLRKQSGSPRRNLIAQGFPDLLTGFDRRSGDEGIL